MVLGPLISARVHLRCEYARRGHGGRVARRVEPRLEAQEGTFDEVVAGHAQAEGQDLGGEDPQGHRLVSERSEEHTSELQSLMRISYAVFCLKKKHKKDRL